jgi:WD40 repeat protein
VAVLAGVAAAHQQGKAEHNAARAVANAKAAVAAETGAEARRAAAQALNTDDIDESMLLAVAGVRLADSPETRSALLAALGRHPELIESLQMAGPQVTCFEVSPDERTVATYDNTNHVRLYNIHSGALMAQFQAGSTARLNWVWRSVRFSPDGQILAVTMAAPSRHPVELLDAHTLAPLESQPGGTARWRWQLNSIAFSQDGHRLASIGWRVRGHGNTTHAASSTWGLVWDLDAPDHPVARMPLDSNGATLAIDVHGRTLYTAGPLARHDVASGRTVLLPEPWAVDAPVEIVEMSPTGRYLAAAGAGGVALLDPRTGELRRQMRVNADDDAFWVSFSDDGRRVAAVDFNDRAAMVWQVASGELVARLPLSDTGEFTDLGKDGSTLYTAGTDSALRQWDLDGHRRFISQVAYVPKDIGDLSFVRPSPGGRFIAYPVGDDVELFDVRTGTLGKPLPRGSGYGRRETASWDPRGVHFAVATEGEIRVWDARTGTLTAHGRPVGRSITAIDFSADGSRLAVGELSGKVTLLDATDLTVVGRPVQLDESVRDVAAGPDNHTAVAVIGYENRSRFWAGSSHRWAQVDLDAGSVLQSGDLSLNADVIDLSPDGRHVAIGGDGALLVLGLESGRPVRKANPAHEALVAMTYSPDGKQILTSGDDASNALWDGRTGELLARVVTPQLVTEAGFGRHPWSVLVAPLFGGSVYEWDSRPRRAIDFACRVAGRDFTEQEWAQEFGARPYRPTCP